MFKIAWGCLRSWTQWPAGKRASHKFLMNFSCLQNVSYTLPPPPPFLKFLILYASCMLVTLFPGPHVHSRKFFSKAAAVADVSFKAGWACLIHFFSPRWHFPSVEGFRQQTFEPRFLPPQLQPNGVLWNIYTEVCAKSPARYSWITVLLTCATHAF